MSAIEALNYVLGQAAKAPTTIDRASADAALLDACARTLAGCVNKAAEADKAAAAAAVPDELVLLAYPIGTEDMVRGRIRAYRDAGVNVLRVAPNGRTAKEQIAHLERSIDLIRSESE